MDPLACLWGKTGLAGGGRSAVEAAEEALLIPVIGKAPTGVSRAMTGRVLADADTLACLLGGLVVVLVEEAVAAWPSGLSVADGCVVVVVESASVMVRAIFPLLCCSIAIFMPTRRLTVVLSR